MTDPDQMDDSFDGGWRVPCHPIPIYIVEHIHRLGILEGDYIRAATPRLY